MPTVKSPVDAFPGSVELPKRLTLPQALAYERAIKKAQDLKADEDARQSEYDLIVLEPICDVVEKWNLRDEDGEDLGELSPNNFPGSPRMASARLVAWLIGEVSAIYNPREDQDPNG